jgi:diketogulonate reductase-like aldo/keto reductase
MSKHTNTWNRREVIAAAAALGLMPVGAGGSERSMHRRPIPQSDETLPVIGLGTYSVFDVNSTAEEIALRVRIVELLAGEGGSVIDTSPMYNRSENVIGDVIDAGVPRDALFLATKVWTDGHEAGLAQMRRSAGLMSTEVIDLMQVHNMRDTDVHLSNIRELQQDGKIRYNGITHYAASAHRRLAAEMQKHKPQFIQINYSLGERDVEGTLLPLARELGIAVIVNRPYQAGHLFGAVRGKELPDWAHEFANSWGQFFLKFIISHPDVTCVIPATSKPHHMSDNLAAGFGALPDAATRKRMVRWFEDL